MFEKIMRLFGKNGASKAILNKRILVIEDGQVERRFIETTLSKQGAKVICAENREIGLRAAKAELPDLVILDYMMPGIKGSEVCKRLKESPETKNIPVIFLTGSATPANVVECYEVGADYYLAKPISAGTLIKQINLTFKDQQYSTDV